MMVIVSAITATVLYIAESNLEGSVARELQREFQGSLAELDHLREIRHAALVERCRALAGRPRIHAALEDDAPDLLYPRAENDLRDLMGRAQFYRFLDAQGAVIPPQKPGVTSPAQITAGALGPSEEAQLALPHLTAEQQNGYLAHSTSGGAEELSEIIGTPILSSETGDVIAALVLGFKPDESTPSDPDLRSGVLLSGRLFSPSLGADASPAIAAAVAADIAAAREEGNNLHLVLHGNPQLHF